MRCLSLLPLLATLVFSGCFIVTDDQDDDGSAGESGEVIDELPVCADPGTNSVEDANGNCVCEEGLIWCTEDPDDVTCCAGACGDPGTNSQLDANDQCACLNGFDWCTDNPMDISCCAL